jgi:hypothetical protein
MNPGGGLKLITRHLPAPNAPPPSQLLKPSTGRWHSGLLHAWHDEPSASRAPLPAVIAPQL